MNTKKPQLIVMGGLDSAEPRSLLLERYVLAASGAPRPVVTFLATGSGDSDANIARIYETFSMLDCRPRHLSLFKRTPDLEETLFSSDVIFVWGGNTRSMLGVWLAWGLPSLFEEAWQRGIVIAGVSAGMICWFEEGITDSSAGRLELLPCLGMIEGSACPHYDGDAERRPTYQRLVREGAAGPGIALDDGAAAHYIGRDLHQIVSSRPGASGYRVALDGEVVVETRLDARVLP